MTSADPTVCRDQLHAKICRHRNYEIDCDEFAALWDRADGRCEICGVAESETAVGRLFIDHDPSAGQGAVRGLLCNPCNSRLHEKGMAGPLRDCYLANVWHRHGRLEYRLRAGLPAVSPTVKNWRGTAHERAVRDGLREAGNHVYLSGPAVNAILDGLARRGLLLGPSGSR